MVSFIPSRDAEAAYTKLGYLINFDIAVHHFQCSIRRLDDRFNIYTTTSPAPFIAPGLIVTPEIRRQSEMYLPIAEIRSVFHHLYRHALHYPPILSTAPFHKALSWADLYMALPPRFQLGSNPARLIEALLSDRDMLTEFLFESFMPRRFYGGFNRYPEQVEFIREWLGKKKIGGGNRLRCLDAASGRGEGTYGLANLLMEARFVPEEIEIEGWTIEPLEVWAAEQRSFPHDREREAIFRRETSRIFEMGYHQRIRFRCADLTEKLPPHLRQSFIDEDLGDFRQFDLILCNGLIGGPIINESEQLERLLLNLSTLLAPDGILLAADSFHGGWKSKDQDIGRYFVQGAGSSSLWRVADSRSRSMCLPRKPCHLLRESL